MDKIKVFGSLGNHTGQLYFLQMFERVQHDRRMCLVFRILICVLCYLSYQIESMVIRA